MACYNAAPYIQKAIDSVVAQTLPDWELIIADDASQDDSLQYIMIASDGDSRIRYISNEVNLGAAITRNSAIAIAKGEWLAILDADDVYLPQKLEKQLEIIRQCSSNLVLIGSGCFYIDSEGRKGKEYNYPTSSLDLKRNLLIMRKFPPHSSLVYRKSSFLAAGGFNVLFARSEDYELCLRLARFGDFSVWPSPLIEYRVHSTNISKTKSRQQLTQIDFGIAAVTCQMLKNADYADPRDFANDYLWVEFLEFVVMSIRRAGYYEHLTWVNDFKIDFQKSSGLFYKFIVISTYFCKSPYGAIRLAREHILGNGLPQDIFKAWVRAKLTS